MTACDTVKRQSLELFHDNNEFETQIQIQKYRNVSITVTLIQRILLAVLSQSLQSESAVY